MFRTGEASLGLVLVLVLVLSLIVLLVLLMLLLTLVRVTLLLNLVLLLVLRFLLVLLRFLLLLLWLLLLLLWLGTLSVVAFHLLPWDVFFLIIIFIVVIAILNIIIDLVTFTLRFVSFSFRIVIAQLNFLSLNEVIVIFVRVIFRLGLLCRGSLGLRCGFGISFSRKLWANWSLLGGRSRFGFSSSCSWLSRLLLGFLLGLLRFLLSLGSFLGLGLRSCFSLLGWLWLLCFSLFRILYLRIVSLNIFVSINVVLVKPHNMDCSRILDKKLSLIQDAQVDIEGHVRMVLS